MALRLNHQAIPTDLAEFDEIILATGIQPRLPEIEGIHHPKVLSYLDVLKARKPVGQKVAIIGAGGIGFDVAEWLSQNGPDSARSPELFWEEWQIDTSLQARGALRHQHAHLPASAREIWLLQRKPGVVGRNLGKTTGWIHRITLKYKGVHMMGGVQYLKIDDDGLHVAIEGHRQILPVDHVVICAGQEPNQTLLAECKNLNIPVHLIGGADVAAELDAKRAIKAGTELALQI
ncbi:FAD-dependent oxidoreductase [Snodgrassella sp. CFCC 13594]|uniref:FAD-dependent oxidoreductase n=1 Tax=Snodgrassella sp. CFCC 13594 TaxID=1775559 RepID=UPI0026F42BA4|nr:FAD-dependent oxidoreductase [Snodgrassella sp. CFCC 13594]